jgi:general secretion pathway protein G
MCAKHAIGRAGVQTMANRNIQRGFTLIELLIVMAILAMLAALVGPALFERLDQGKQNSTLTQIKLIESGLDGYRIDMDNYPNSLDDLVTNTENDARWDGPYLQRATEVPTDAWKNAFIYSRDGKNFSLKSYGADGVEGGEGPDADIGK